MRIPQGFTIIELMVTITIAAILLTVAVPSYQAFIAENRVAGGSNELMASLAFARSEAIKRATRVTLCKSANATTCGGAGWEVGWIVFLDSNSNGTRETAGVAPPENLLRVVSTQTNGVTIRGNNNFINFVAYLSGGGSSNVGTFAVCNNSTLAGSRAIIINSTGRPRLGRDTDGNNIPNKDDGNDIASCNAP